MQGLALTTHSLPGSKRDRLLQSPFLFGHLLFSFQGIPSKRNENTDTMKSCILFSISILAFLFQFPHAMAQNELDRRVETLLEQMTLKEKVGQMTQLTVDMIVKGQPYAPQVPVEIDEEKLRKAVIEYGVGSILNTPSGVLLGLEEWHRLHAAIQQAVEQTRLKIPILYGIDAIHGVNYCKGATLFPQPVAVACTWNPDLARDIAAITAYECRAAGFPWNFSPALDVGRNPEWPRLWESFGEDVLLNERLGVATVEGYQGDDPAAPDKVAACLKHFTGYGMPWSGKDRTPAYIPERQLREYFLPAYQAAVDAGALTLMVNSGEINGVPVHASKFLLTDVLRGELGFEGLVVSDWEDINYLHTRHKVAATKKEAVRMAVEAGIDMSMVPTDYDFPTLLLELVQEGTIPESRIEASVRRILKVKMALGLFERPLSAPADYPDFGSEKHRRKSLEAARESIVLLKNEGGALPLKEGAKVLVTGPTAHTLRSINGGWTFTWQGERADELAPEKMTILEALRAKLGVSNVGYAPGASYDEALDIEGAVKAAEAADVIVLCLGELSYTEFMGSLTDMNLPEAQYELARALARTGKPIVLVLAEGRPRIVRQVEPLAAAVVGVFLPGMEGAEALAEILLGQTNPSGKLPFTYPRHSNSLVPYDHKFTEEVLSNELYGPYFNPQWEFGHGLSYTTFAYEGLELSTERLPEGGSLEVRVRVRNSGARPGKEVVQLYVRDDYAGITPPVKRLRGFEKIELQPGEVRTVSFTLRAEDLAFVGLNNQWVTEPGTFTVFVGGLEKSFEYVP